MLNIEPGITASRICDVIRLDKGAVSRALKLLDGLGHLTSEQPAGDPRKRLWRLSQKGQRIYADIMAVALRCEAELVDGIAPVDLAMSLSVLRRMLVNIDPKTPGIHTWRNAQRRLKVAPLSRTDEMVYLLVRALGGDEQWPILPSGWTLGKRTG